MYLVLADVSEGPCLELAALSEVVSEGPCLELAALSECLCSGEFVLAAVHTSEGLRWGELVLASRGELHSSSCEWRSC